MTEDKLIKLETASTGAPDDEKSRITLPRLQDIQFMGENPDEKRQSMRGFNPRYANFVDYILGVTHEIWEERGIGKLYDYYANTIHLHTSYGSVYGREAVFASTIEALAAYPDRRLYGDEVIWGGNDVDGLYSSHRLMHEGTNRGWTKYGPPTGKRIQYLSIADCFCKRNQVVEEWICRDELTCVLQLGLDPVATAKDMNAREIDSDFQPGVFGDIERGSGQFPPPAYPAPTSDDFDPEYFVKGMFHEMWNWRLMNKAREYYHDNLVFVGPTQRKFKGITDLQQYMLALLSPFPDLAIRPDHFCYVGDAEAGYRAATRWTMRGTHTGYGLYGEPTGNPIRIIGVSHHVIRDGRIANEWTVFDEFALLRQITA